MDLNAVDLLAFPGGDLVSEGRADLARGHESIPALLVLIGAPRLRELGLHVPELPSVGTDLPEHRLYLVLAQRSGTAAHGEYNALLRRLVSFERAFGCVR